MVDRYFEKFPLINYTNNAVVNITQRAEILNSVMNTPYVFYPLDINNGIRPDQIADKLYNDTYKSWILYLSNKIIDPYYQWYLQPDDFNEYLKKKYNIGSTDILKQKITFYRNNWYEIDNITVAGYNALSGDQKEYWQPVYGNSSTPLSYQRKKEDWIVNTNKIVRYTVNNAPQFIKNEIVKIHLFYAPGYTGRGQVVIANSSSVTLQHISGYSMKEEFNENNFTFTQTETPKIDSEHTIYVDEASNILSLEPFVLGPYSRLYGTESNANVQVYDTNLIQTNISNTVFEYWSPVAIYDMETENNEYNKSINVLDPSYSIQISKELKKLLV